MRSIIERVYEIVLREAVQQDELATWLDPGDAATTVAHSVPAHGVRQAWGLRHPDLTGHQAAA